MSPVPLPALQPVQGPAGGLAVAVPWATYQGGHDSPGSVEPCRVWSGQVGIVGEIGDGEVDGETLGACSGRWWMSGSCKKHGRAVRWCRSQAVEALGGQALRSLASQPSSPALVTMGKAGRLPACDRVCEPSPTTTPARGKRLARRWLPLGSISLLRGTHWV